MPIKWRPVNGFDGFYKCGDDGSVVRLKGFWCKHARQLKGDISNSGYVRVRLFKNGDRKGVRVSLHRLVYETFNGPIPKGMTVNHVNGKKTDNRACNLKMASMREQMLHAYETGLQKKQRGSCRKNVALLNESDVLSIRSRYVPRKTPMELFAEEYGVSEGCIFKVIHRQTWTHI